MKAPYPSAIRRCLGAFAGAIAIVAFAVAGGRADDRITLTHQGVERTAVLHQAAGAARPAPLLIALQGLGQSTDALRDTLKLNPVADREGFAVLYPDAIEHKWSYGRPIIQPMPTVGGETVDDVGLLRRLLDDLVARKVADPARVYVTGMSRGGLMALTLACTLADRIAAAAVLITGMTEAQREDWGPARAVPMMVT